MMAMKAWRSSAGDKARRSSSLSHGNRSRVTRMLLSARPFAGIPSARLREPCKFCDPQSQMAASQTSGFVDHWPTRLERTSIVHPLSGNFEPAPHSLRCKHQVDHAAELVGDEVLDDTGTVGR
jgi:hypothetical protein